MKVSGLTLRCGGHRRHMSRAGDTSSCRPLHSRSRTANAEPLQHHRSQCAANTQKHKGDQCIRYNNTYMTSQIRHRTLYQTKYIK